MRFAPRTISLYLLVVSLVAPKTSAHPEDFDVVIYGGTSGGIAAAVMAARMGKTVALVSPSRHLGGLTASGLGWTDLGRNQGTGIVGGLSKEFYHRVYLHYSAQPNWNSVRSMSGQHTAGFDQTNQLGYIFEPKVATRIFGEMLSETDVRIFTGLLDLSPAGVAMSGLRIESIRLEDGRVFRGKMFIDASYEGDVMAGAGVDFTVGREASSVYGESVNGIQYPATNNVVAGLDPYQERGNPGSGLLPGIEAGVPPIGTGDGALQAFCYRMCLTSNSANRVMVGKPDNYKEEDFELVIRAVEAGQTTFLKNDNMPNGKTDTNNSGGVSLDYIGKNWGSGWDWSTLDHQQRAALAAEHRYWQLGLLWTIQHHPRVLAKVGPNGLYPGLGLAADEFTTNGNFPPELYVREARRMVSDYVMTEKNCDGRAVAPDSVAMGAYTMDSHSTRRFVHNGVLKNEGGLGKNVPAPYPISYRSLVPRIGQCENLLVPWCLSTSHVAFGSARMEPVFMAMGQSAATAATLAINDGTSVQQVPYEKLAAVLRADGQVLTFATAETETIVDTENPSGTVVTGNWATSSSTAGFNGTGYLHDGNEGRGEKSIRFTPVIPATDNYRVSLRWTEHANRSSHVPVVIRHGTGEASATVDQRSNGGVWYDLGVFKFHEGTSGDLLISNTGADGYVIADAAKWTRLNDIPTVGLVSPVPETIRGGSIPAVLVFTRDGDTSAPLEVLYQVSGSALPSSFTPQPAGAITIPAGKRESKLSLAALSSGTPQGDKSLLLQLSPHSSYTLDQVNSALVGVRDTPFDAWRLTRFSSAELSNPAISGPFADPDGSGTVNLLRFFSGTGSHPRTSLVVQGDVLYFEFDRARAAAGLDYEVEESDDLSRWTLAPRLSIHAPVVDHGEIHQIRIPIRSSAPMAEGRRYFRLKVPP